MQAFADQLAQATASSQRAENALAISEEWRATEVLVHRETLRALKDAKQHTESEATTPLGVWLRKQSITFRDH